MPHNDNKAPNFFDGIEDIPDSFGSRGLLSFVKPPGISSNIGESERKLATDAFCSLCKDLFLQYISDAVTYTYEGDSEKRFGRLSLILDQPDGSYLKFRVIHSELNGGQYEIEVIEFDNSDFRLKPEQRAGRPRRKFTYYTGALPFGTKADHVRRRDREDLSNEIKESRKNPSPPSERARDDAELLGEIAISVGVERMHEELGMNNQPVTWGEIDELRGLLLAEGVVHSDVDG